MWFLVRRRGRPLIAGAAALLVSAAGPALPPPAADPLRGVASDPVLRFADTALPDAAFRAAVAAALAREPEVLQADAQADEADAARREARAGLRPRLDFDLSGQRVISRDFSNDPNNILERSRPRGRADAVVAAEQLLTDFGATRNRLEAARARERAAEQRAAVIAEDAALRAAAAWYGLYAARAEATLTDGLLARNRIILAQTRERAGSGLGTEGDVTRVEQSLALAEVARIRAAQGADAAASRYERAFGQPAPAEVARPDAPAPALTLDAARAMVDQRPDVLFAQRSVEGARRDLAAARSDRLPRVTTGIDAARFNVTSDVVDHDVRGRLSIRQRLYGGGQSEARMDGAAARVAQAEFGLARARQDGERDVAIAWTELRARERELDRLRDGYVASRKTRDVFVEQFRVTRGNLLELLRAESDLQQSASLFIRGVAERDLARVRLLAETGRILPYFGVKTAQ